MTSIIQNAQPLAEIKKIKTFDLTTSCAISENQSFNKSSDEVYDTANLTENGDLIAVASNTENFILCVDSPIWSNSLLASGSKDNSIIFWKIEEDLKNNLMEVDNEESEEKEDENKEEEENVLVKQIAIASGHTHSVSSIAFSHSNKLPFIVSVSHDTTLKLWPLIDLMVKQEENGENKLLKLSSSSTIVAHSKDINSVDISQNDKLCVTASMDKTAKLWNLNTKNMEFVNVGVLSGHKRGVWCARFSENLQLVATCSGDCTIKIFSLLDKTCVKTLEGHQFAILSLLFIEKSLKIISVDGGGILRLWNIKKGICECVEEGHNEKIWSLRRVANNDFNWENENDDDEEIDLKTSYWITGSADGFITIWRDNTKIKKNLTIKAATKRITDQQTLENLLQQNSLFEALLYTLDLDLPFQCLKILRKLSSNLNRKEELEQQKLINLIKKMSKIQLSTLLQYSTQWNTNSKTYSIAQLILNCVLKSFPPEEILKLPNIEIIIQRLLPYSLRHQERIKNFQKNAAHIDYMFSSMRLN